MKKLIVDIYFDAFTDYGVQGMHKGVRKAVATPARGVRGSKPTPGHGTKQPMPTDVLVARLRHLYGLATLRTVKPGHVRAP